MTDVLSRPSKEAPTSVRGMRMPRLGGATVFGLLLGFLAAAASHSYNRAWSGDVWLHMAVVRELARSPGDPSHPVLAREENVPYYSPYSIGLGILVRLTGLRLDDAFVMAGACNAVLLIVGMFVLCRPLTTRPWPAVGLLLLFSLTLWGLLPWRWSGFLNANSLGFSLPYPSAFATACALATLGMSLGYRDRHGLRPLVAVAVLAATTLLTHPLTGAWLAVALLCAAVGLRLWRHGVTAVKLLAAWTAGLVLAALWPYYSLTVLVTGSGTFTSSHDALYEQMPARLALIAVTLPAIMARARRDRLDPLVLMACMGVVLVAVGAVTGQWTAGRLLPLPLLALHLSLALELVERRPSQRSAAIVGAAVLVGLAACAPGLSRAVPAPLLLEAAAERTSGRAYDDLSFLADHVGARDVVMVPQTWSAQVPALAGRVVSSRYPDATVEDAAERAAAVEMFFAVSTTREARLRIARDYDAQWVLVPAGRPDVELGEGARVVATGGGLVLLTIAP